jgi:hypothetical protein
MSLWSVTGKRMVQQFSVDSDIVFSLAVSADEKHLAAGDQEGTVTVWSVPSTDFSR